MIYRPQRLLLPLLGFFMAVSAPLAASAKVKVVATLPDLGAVAREIGGEHVEVTVLASEVQDPHYVDARPSLLLPLRDADLLIVNGLELEVGWLPNLLTNARNGDIQQGGNGWVDASTVVTRLQVFQPDRSRGDVHPGGNPHYMYDPVSVLKVAALIARRLGAVDPKNAAAYAEKAKRFDKKLRFIINAEAKKFAKLPAERRNIVGYHMSLAYLNRWLGLKTIMTMERRPGIPPTPGHVGDVLRRMKADKIKVIVQEPWYPRKASQTLAKLTGGAVAFIPGGTRFRKGETYIMRVRRTAKVIYDALSK